MVYQSESLHDRHKLTAFDCGKPELNLWLHNSARHAHAMRACTTTVWHGGDDVVLGFYGLAAHVIEREQLSRKLGRGNPDQIPAVLIARLALDVSIQGAGYGGVLLADAFERIVAASDNVAVRFVVVDAIDDDAAKFYEKHGFAPTPVAGRLVRKLSSIAADFS
jgi:GNAT superfamily N-acetyltransferase